MVHGQRFELGGLLLTAGFALGLGPGLATVIGLAGGAGPGLGAAGGGGGWLAFGSPGSRCRHGGTPPKERGDRGTRAPAPRQCAGESAGTSQCYKREPDRKSVV